jgi:rhamnopyranosyl-N-acetylglucosaminyl-diphospho-decaprenol beta-1,3/1,4-galactofuranosyltransferase
MTLSIASVTTAYNAAKVLPRQMDALLRQSLPLKEIIVVDNASTDGTASLLAERYPQVTVLSMPANLGAAGAWAEGLKYAARQRKHDWIWAFDDDSIPGPNALEGLLLAAQSQDCRSQDSHNQASHNQDSNDGEIGMIAVLPVHRETGIAYPPLLWRDGFRRPHQALLNRPVWFADLAIASGLMVRREVVEKVGLPRADFFMDFFDFEYCLRARSYGYRIAVATGVQLSHEVGRARHVRLPGFRALWPDHAPWREYYISRNFAYVVWWLYPSFAAKWFSIRHMLRHAGGALCFSSARFSAVKRMVQGFLDGRRARLGIRFRPGPDQRPQQRSEQESEQQGSEKQGPQQYRSAQHA